MEPIIHESSATLVRDTDVKLKLYKEGFNIVVHFTKENWIRFLQNQPYTTCAIQVEGQ